MEISKFIRRIPRWPNPSQCTSTTRVTLRSWQKRVLITTSFNKNHQLTWLLWLISCVSWLGQSTTTIWSHIFGMSFSMQTPTSAKIISRSIARASPTFSANLASPRKMSMTMMNSTEIKSSCWAWRDRLLARRILCIVYHWWLLQGLVGLSTCGSSSAIWYKREGSRKSKRK